MRILITGATGFIGSRLVDRLAAANQIYALVRRRPDEEQPAVHYLHQDLAQPLDHACLPAHVDAVIHQAAVIDTGAVDEAQPFLVNVVGTWRLLAYAEAAGAHTFVHASSGGIYGCRDHPFVEDDAAKPMDLYSLTKAQAELAVRSAPGNFSRVILRYFFPYGVGTPNPIPDYVRRAVTGEPVSIQDSSKPSLNPIHIDDAVEATVRAVHLYQEAVINVAGNETTSFAEIVSMAAEAAGREPNVEWIPDSSAIPYYRADLVADIQRMERLLSFSPQIPLEQGIAELAAHYISHS